MSKECKFSPKEEHNLSRASARTTENVFEPRSRKIRIKRKKINCRSESRKISNTPSVKYEAGPNIAAAIASFFSLTVLSKFRVDVREVRYHF